MVEEIVAEMSASGEGPPVAIADKHYSGKFQVGFRRSAPPSRDPCRRAGCFRERAASHGSQPPDRQPCAEHLVREVPGDAAAGGAPRGTGARTIA